MRKIAILGLSLLAVFALACGTGNRTPTQGPGVDAPGAGDATAPARTATKVVFEVVGEDVATANSISYGIGGNQSQANDAALPWTKEATATDSFLIVSLVAQSGSGRAGKITCRITVDGKVLVENTSEGPYAVVTCTETG